jgi:hypothetical protein
MRIARPFWLRVGLIAALFTVVWLLPNAARAGIPDPTETSNFLCGSKVVGSLTVTADGSVSVFGGPFQCPDGSWTINGGMNITATATPVAGYGKSFAWMQAIISANTGSINRDANNNNLAAPWPDTPPGGYRLSDICGQPPFVLQPFDDQPWYANNQIGDLTLVDQPKNGIGAGGACSVQFESWLVCVTGKTGNAFNVIPLMGFDWGFTFQRTGDMNNDGINGNDLNEYAGSTNLGALIQGGQPSAAFKAGYAKYFPINYLTNNDDNCRECCPEPTNIALSAMGVVTLMGYRWRRRAAA